MLSLLSAPVETIDVDLIDESPLNPREHWEGIKELAASLRRGQLEPIILREFDGRPGRFELVDGARRLRAARSGKIAELAARVFDLTDPEVLQIILGKGGEGNVDPLTAWEEGVAYDRALKVEPGLTLEKLSERHGRSKFYLHQRLSLLNLPAESKTALQKRVIAVNHAWLIARMPGEDARKKAEGIVLHGAVDGGVMSFAEARRALEKLVCKDLSDAPFDVTDAALIPAAGPCAKFDSGKKVFCGICPYHADTDRETYGDVKSAHKCMHPSCYDQKVTAMRERVLARTVTGGKIALTEEENAAAFVPEEKGLAVKSDYVAWTASPTRDMLKPEVQKVPAWSELCAGDATPQVYVGIDQGGRAVDLVKLSEALVAVPKQELAIFSDAVLRRHVLEKPRAGEAPAAAKVKPAAKAKTADQDDDDPDGGDVKDDLPETPDEAPAVGEVAGWVQRSCNWIAAALEAAPTLPPGVRSAGFQLLREMGAATVPQVEASPAVEPEVTADRERLLEWHKAHKLGMSPQEIAKSYSVTLEDVCGALEIDVKAVRFEFEQLREDAEKAFEECGLTTKAVRNRVTKVATGVATFEGITTPTQLRSLLRMLSQKRNAPSSAPPAAA